MAVKAVQIPVPADGSEVAVVDDDGDHIMGNEMTYRNTGAVDLLVGGPGSCVYPLAKDPNAGGFGEALGGKAHPGDILYVKVAQADLPQGPNGPMAPAPGDGELTALKMG